MSRLPLPSIVAEAPIIAIVRRPKVDPVRCIEHLFQAGIRLIEITMDTAGAIEVLQAQRSRVPAGGFKRDAGVSGTRFRRSRGASSAGLQGGAEMQTHGDGAEA